MDENIEVGSGTQENPNAAKAFIDKPSFKKQKRDTVHKELADMKDGEIIVRGSLSELHNFLENYVTNE